MIHNAVKTVDIILDITDQFELPILFLIKLIKSFLLFSKQFLNDIHVFGLSFFQAFACFELCYTGFSIQDLVFPVIMDKMPILAVPDCQA